MKNTPGHDFSELSDRELVLAVKKQLGWTQLDLGKAMGVSQKTVSSWEHSGKKIPADRRSYLEKLLTASSDDERGPAERVAGTALVLGGATLAREHMLDRSTVQSIRTLLDTSVGTCGTLPPIEVTYIGANQPVSLDKGLQDWWAWCVQSGVVEIRVVLPLNLTTPKELSNLQAALEGIAYDNPRRDDGTAIYPIRVIGVASGTESSWPANRGDYPSVVGRYAGMEAMLGAHAGLIDCRTVSGQESKWSGSLLRLSSPLFPMKLWRISQETRNRWKQGVDPERGELAEDYAKMYLSNVSDGQLTKEASGWIRLGTAQATLLISAVDELMSFAQHSDSQARPRKRTSG